MAAPEARFLSSCEDDEEELLPPLLFFELELPLLLPPPLLLLEPRERPPELELELELLEPDRRLELELAGLECESWSWDACERDPWLRLVVAYEPDRLQRQGL